MALSSFPDELLQSQAFFQSSHPADKSIANSRFDITDEDLAAYYEQEGRDFFGSTESAKLYEEHMMNLVNRHMAENVV